MSDLGERLDGRIQRSRRTRAAIIEALVRLLRAGRVRPTAKEIAEEAGVSVRTVWTSFGDMEALLGAVAAYWAESDQALSAPIDADQPLPERIEEFCAQRARRLANIAPAARSALMLQSSSPALRASRLAHLRRARRQLAEVFARELAASPDPELLLELALAAVSWSTWSLLRDDRRLSTTRARAAMATQLHALLEHR